MFRLKAVFLLILLVFLTRPAVAAPPAITADAAILMDVQTGQVYYAKNHYRRAEPASLTKIMTAVVALENGNLGDVVTVGGRAAAVSMGSIIDLRKGEKITLEELLKAALISSANDSTVAIAEHVGGSHERFIKMMNAKAAVLGLFGTRYANTNGYHDPNHYTTARDLAVLTRCALGHPKFNELVQTKEAAVRWVEPPEREEKIINSNRLLFGGYEGIDGVKTGTTPMAGNCLAASATREGRRLIAVVLHSDNRYQDCVRLFEYGFNVIRPVLVVRAGEVVAKRPVTGGSAGAVEAVAEKDLEVRLDPDDLAKLEKRVETGGPVAAPVKKGQKIGESVYLLHGQEVGRVNLLAGTWVPKKGWYRQLWDKVSG
ncbi:D-alanyl-D-alanine carboxypeptidase [Pelotomaculum thermopropionicum SI]|uniref:serine-type D-Ala-D-Ala carboxypeptidase n=1 Tax=Pelotomaculum thermopropionicum (strain DSM 13744 / JCM 10971 / SI) TaxID=370438 RepID=A5D0S7_PELTS|nr:D-alanyl-D-alanine carboxypeptidase [Pelotomaculum thermopropionicum SI]